jgi:hypothetical protein
MARGMSEETCGAIALAFEVCPTLRYKGKIGDKPWLKPFYAMMMAIIA